jgi:phage shock protein PspC (stress-responsive transcriptional regulator)
MEERKRIVRNTEDRVLGGVASGLAAYFGVDKMLIRVIFVALGLINGVGVFLYLVLWVVIPSPASAGLDDEEAIRANVEDLKRRVSTLAKDANLPRGSSLGGIVLVALGVIFLANQFMPYLSIQILLPLVLILAGGILLISQLRR